MTQQTEIDPADTFARFGKTFQEKTAQALLCDALFAEQMADVVSGKYFELKYLQEVVDRLYEYKTKYKHYPSPDVLEIMVNESETDDIVKGQVREFVAHIKEHPLNGDTGFIQAQSLEFCKKQLLKEAVVKVIDHIEDRDYDSIQSIIKDALSKGANRELGHDYMDGFEQRSAKSIRKPIPTGWGILDKELNGGWERATLTTFIAPTGAGKSMFLCNVSAAAIAQGLNSLYITCEMADWKIGLRHDSYFSGVAINDVPGKAALVETTVREKVKGRLWVKEFPTKTASVQTIRSYIQRLEATKNFKPDILVVDYADLLRSTRNFGGEKRFELEGVYEELRALAQELNIVVITADQTNRGGLEAEVVTLAAIAESYAKATVCDVIITISRRREDKQTNSGRIFIAKSRLGRDGVVYPFLLNTATVKVTILDQHEDPVALYMDSNKNLQSAVAERFGKKTGSGERN